MQPGGCFDSRVNIIFTLGIQYKIGNNSFVNITKNVHIEGKGLSDNVTKIMEYDVDGPNIILDESKSQTFITN